MDTAKKRQRCPICGSRRFRRDRGSGHITCEEGHFQAIVEETVQIEPRAGQRVITRKQHKERARKEKPGKKTYVGSKARYLQMQCYQLLLRKQVAALRKAFGFPEDLEIVAHDLWGAYVSLLDLDAPPLHQQQNEQELLSLPARANRAPDPLSQSMQRQMELEMEESSEDSDDTTAPAATIDLAGLRKDKPMREKTDDPTKRFRTRFTLVICYLALIYLRYPVMVNDIMVWVEERVLPYIQAIDYLPASMRQHLDHDMLAGFDITGAPALLTALEGDNTMIRGDGFINWVNRFVRMYDRKLGITFPPYNTAPMLWRCIRTLALPPDAFWKCFTILDMVNMDIDRKAFNLDDHSTLSPTARWMPAEVHFIAAALLLVRVVWGIEAEPRRALDDRDPLNHSLSRDQLLAAIEGMETIEEEGDLRTSFRIPVEQLKDIQIDGYLDFLQDSLPQVSKPYSHPELIERLFPLPPIEQTDVETRAQSREEALEKYLSEVYSERVPLLAPSDLDIPRSDPGGKSRKPHMTYMRFKIGDPLGDVPEVFDRLLERATRLTGIDKEVIIKTTIRMETLLFRAASTNIDEVVR